MIQSISLVFVSPRDIPTPKGSGNSSSLFPSLDPPACWAWRWGVGEIPALLVGWGKWLCWASTDLTLFPEKGDSIVMSRCRFWGMEPGAAAEQVPGWTPNAAGPQPGPEHQKLLQEALPPACSPAPMAPELALQETGSLHTVLLHTPYFAPGLPSLFHSGQDPLSISGLLPQEFLRNMAKALYPLNRVLVSPTLIKNICKQDGDCHPSLLFEQQEQRTSRPPKWSSNQAPLS